MTQKPLSPVHLLPLLPLLLLLLALWLEPHVLQLGHADIGCVVAAADSDATVHHHCEELVVAAVQGRGARAPLLQGQGERCLQWGVHLGQAHVGVHAGKRQTQGRRS